jgi:tetratricopeptide (TPR) repeat protein
LALAEKALSGTDDKVKQYALGLLIDFADTPEALARIKPLLPVIRSLATGDTRETKSTASELLGIFAKPSIELAIEKLKSKDFAAALAAADAALAISPASEEALILRAEVYREGGDIEAAVKDYLEALSRFDYPYWASPALENTGLEERLTDPEAKDEIRKALEKCIRDNACYAKLRLWR